MSVDQENISRWKDLGAESVQPPNSRFDRIDRFLATEGARTFFGPARWVPALGMYIGVFKQAFNKAGIGAKGTHIDEQATYGPWLTLDRTQIFVLGTDNEPVTDDQIVELYSRGDPAMRVISKLEQLRRDDFPEVARDKHVMTKCLEAYEVVAASIHGRPKS